MLYLYGILDNRKCFSIEKRLKVKYNFNHLQKHFNKLELTLQAAG